MDNHPYISVIIPVYNAEKFLAGCLDAISSSSFRKYELIVVDDCSTDESAKVGHDRGAKILRMSRQSGPGGARNLGAKNAAGEILFFVDADVVVKPDTLERVAANFKNHPEVAAVFGSYDEEPAEQNFISQYKNLFHRFVHQQGSTEASTFWAGCGGVRREIFLALDGFDAERYPRPAIEDIELGYRMRQQGHRILLDKQLQGKHLKRWTLRSMLHADIFRRAVPWSTLILESENMVNDLNLQTSDRISAGLVALSLLILPFSIFAPQLLLLIVGLLALVPLLNYKLYLFFFHRKGLTFAILAFPLHLLYYLYSGVTFVLCWCRHQFVHLFGRESRPKNYESDS
ncbi:MAG TPA: glycosyltransferase family A protein [Pyrinomonadaceae bacterium]|nr:glycosyltransferase family A protein [Pyrinomonadaceae bacterium]